MRDEIYYSAGASRAYYAETVINKEDLDDAIEKAEMFINKLKKYNWQG